VARCPARVTFQRPTRCPGRVPEELQYKPAPRPLHPLQDRRVQVYAFGDQRRLVTRCIFRAASESESESAVSSQVLNEPWLGCADCGTRLIDLNHDHDHHDDGSSLSPWQVGLPCRTGPTVAPEGLRLGACQGLSTDHQIIMMMKLYGRIWNLIP
jgi:hypothetical protein